MKNSIENVIDNLFQFIEQNKDYDDPKDIPPNHIEDLDFEKLGDRDFTFVHEAIDNSELGTSLVLTPGIVVFR